MSLRPLIEAVENPLTPMVASRRGLTPERALADARSRVRAMQPRCLTELDRRLALIVAFVHRPDAPLRADELSALRRHAEAGLTLCGGLDRPGLDQALLLLSAQCDALGHARGRRRRRALSPAIHALSLLRAGTVTPAETEALLDGLRQCLARYL